MRFSVIMILLLLLPVTTLAGKKEERQAKERAAAEELLAKAEAGDVQAQFVCGSMLVQGKILDQDQDRGIALLEQAADSGDMRATIALYELYEEGRYGVAKNPDKADYWAVKGNIPSPRIQAKNDQQARDELKRQAAEGSLAASTMLALDKAAEPDIAALEKNALAGDQTACGILFDLHMKDKYEPGPDVEQAWERFNLLSKDKVKAMTAGAQGK